MAPRENLIVARYKRASHYGIGGIEAHGRRLGEVKNIDRERTHLNEFPIGGPDLGAIVDARILEMQKHNADLRRRSLERRRRKSELKDLEGALEDADGNTAAMAEVIGWPWDPKNGTPFTEGIISVSHAWFLDSEGQIDPAKVDTFRDFSVGYIKEEFGDEVIYARLDLDEKTPHLSFLVAPEHEEKRTGRRMLSHSKHRLFGRVQLHDVPEDERDDDVPKPRSYELMQSRIAEYAERHGFDLRRGARRAKSERFRIAAGDLVIKRKNVSPSKSREQATAALAEADLDRSLAKADRKRAEKQAAEAAAKIHSAEATSARAEKRLAEAEAKATAMEVGADAILQDVMAYAPPTDEGEGSLTWGRNRPRDPQRRQWLKDVIQPARAWVVGFAKRVWLLREREAVAERQEADLRRKAEIVAQQAHRIRGSAPAELAAVAAGNGPERAEDFPGAWAIDKAQKPDVIDKRLRHASNLSIRQAEAATRDAVLLCDEKPDMAEDFRRGLRTLPIEAQKRGFDLESGQHDPTRATDPSRARLHTDALPQPMRKRRVAKDNVLTRG